MTDEMLFELWDKNIPLNAEKIPLLETKTDVIIQRPDRDYAFLHDCMIIQKDDTLFTAWYNCPVGEMEGASVIRGRSSKDAGRSWSDLITMAEDASGKFLYVPPAFGVCGNVLYLLVTRMTGVDLVQDFEIFKYKDAEKRFSSVRVIDEPFIPNTQAYRMANGKLIVGGRWSDTKGTYPLYPAVAISDSGKIDAPWRIVLIHQQKTLPDGTDFIFPETGLIIEDNNITAFVRNDKGGPLLFKSSDFGESWGDPLFHNLPLGPVKIAAGLLSDGRKYVIGNLAGYRRDKLMIAFAEPGKDLFSKAFLLQDGINTALNASPEWSYPAAWEADGNLYVVYTSGKTSAAMSVIPLKSIV